MKRREYIQSVGMGGMLCLLTPRVGFSLHPEGPSIGNPTSEIYESLLNLRKPARTIRMDNDGFLWLDAGDFESYGGWVLDTQFVNLTGSACLLSPGADEPVGDAVTRVQIRESGIYNVWVRSRNWLRPDAPGRFTLVLNGAVLSREFGTADTDEWVWESPASVRLESGPLEIRLRDLTGYHPRCSSILIARDPEFRPDSRLKAFEAQRRRFCGIADEPADGGTYDLIVAGGGPAGVPAALAAARLGLRVLLLQDRPVLGGNAGLECGIGIVGAGDCHDYMRETGLIEEVQRLTEFRGDGYRVSGAFAQLCDEEKNLTVRLNQMLTGVQVIDSCIRSVETVCTLTGARFRYASDRYIDCSGDGWLGFYAGAEIRFGREARSEFSESLAPEAADRSTMSGVVKGLMKGDSRDVSRAFYVEDTGAPYPAVLPLWAPQLPPAKEFGRQVTGFSSGYWWNEHDGLLDDFLKPEQCRDELMRLHHSFWYWLKTEWKEKNSTQNWDLKWIGPVLAKRETNRLVGDYILNENDVMQARHFPDTIAYAGWKIDIHHPRGLFSGKEGPFYCNAKAPVSEIPYRCIYSRNIQNLWMAGRNISVSHIALGTTRVMATCALIGQAAGTAAALALRLGETPKGIGERHIRELQQQLLRDDFYLPGVKNEDQGDLARTAECRASSTAAPQQLPVPSITMRSLDGSPSNVINGWNRPNPDGWNMWISDPARPLPQSLALRWRDRPVTLRTIQITFDTDLEKSQKHRFKQKNSHRFVRQCVRDFSVEVYTNGQWIAVASIKDNWRRFVVLQFPPVTVEQIRINVTATHGDPSARIIEVRAYA